MKTDKLPVKYALMPIIDFNKVFGTILITNDRTVGYFVSKCYVLEENKKYNEDGTTSRNYKVVFPYSEVFLNNKIKELKNDFENDQYLSYSVDEVYNDYESAKEACDIKNSDCLNDEKELRKDYKKFRESITSKVDEMEQKAKMISPSKLTLCRF